MPILSRGDEWVFAQNLAHVVKFLGLNEKTGPVLSPDQLIARSNVILSAAVRLIPQMPDSLQENQAPGRPRSYKVLSYHIFRIQEVFLEMANGATLTYEALAGTPSEDMKTFADIAAHGDRTRANLMAWWAAKADKSGKETVQTYYGPQLLHETLERATWHSGQHVRQWAMLLGMAGIAPDRPLTAEDYAGLPMPKDTWDG